ncbi:NAD(P)/FAD-dependent oxidoreductase [Mangrovicoccus algicola]|uniref:FAD-dependent oxidoreductase n=1 Tax=Mangrovicoccus algicola TaxID=2771008 RepID=A0A8J6YYC4_9RHOB|nr:FAD-dependent oxidoreductase [Mangrovicoccus algicola]MBE3640057.1 FAD-dependent oxidoreductase [Mangrovicoccus algicola]
MEHVVVIGAGQAGFSLAAKLRGEGFSGRLTLIGDEPHPPYQRPPLSKKYLLGEMEKERLFFRPPAFYAEQGIELRLGRGVGAIDRTARTVTLGDEVIGWDTLAICTGAEPLRVPAARGGDLAGVYAIRRLADIDACGAEFRPGRRLVVIGGGYVGLEAAAVARSRGLEVVLLQRSERILRRVASAETAAFIHALHERHGVEIRLDAQIARLTGEGRVDGVELACGTRIPADFVIAGIGADCVPPLAVGAGLSVGRGILVDAFGRTSDPAIWAAGDCAEFAFRDAPTLLESVQNAVDQAETVARNMLGAAVPYEPAPWFWSDQYDLSLQIAGLGRGHDRVVMRPGAREGSRSHWYYRGGTLLACDAMNDPRAYMTAKRLLESGRSPDPALVADPQVELKSFLR